MSRENPRVDYSFFQREAISALERLGLNMPMHPGGAVGAVVEILNGEQREHGWPKNLSEVGDDEVSAWISHIAAWLDYALTQRGLVAAVKLRAEDHLSRRRHALLLTSRQSLTATRVKAQVEAEPEVARLRGVVVQAKSETAVLDGIVDGLEAKRLAIKDEVSRRQSATWSGR